MVFMVLFWTFQPLPEVNNPSKARSGDELKPLALAVPPVATLSPPTSSHQGVGSFRLAGSRNRVCPQATNPGKLLQISLPHALARWRAKRTSFGLRPPCALAPGVLHCGRYHIPEHIKPSGWIVEGIFLVRAIRNRQPSQSFFSPIRQFVFSQVSRQWQQVLRDVIA
jgi:hypothetical protein